MCFFMLWLIIMSIYHETNSLGLNCLPYFNASMREDVSQCVFREIKEKSIENNFHNKSELDEKVRKDNLEDVLVGVKLEKSFKVGESFGC